MKAGGGHIMTIGEMSTHFLTKLEWYSTLFPRIPVPIQKQIEQNLLAKKAERIRNAGGAAQGRADTNRPVQQEERYKCYWVFLKTITPPFSEAYKTCCSNSFRQFAFGGPGLTQNKTQKLFSSTKTPYAMLILDEIWHRYATV